MVTSVVDPVLRLPTLPFRARAGAVAVAQYGRFLGVEFVPVLRALAGVYGDDEVATAVVEPATSYYRGHYGFLPGFLVPADALDDWYWEGLRYAPCGDPTGEIGESGGVVAVTGSSRRWAVWGQRSWDLVLVWALERGRWLDAGVPFVSPRTALEDFAGYGTWGTRLRDDDAAAFVRNVETFD
jgi:hypothetical protein